jgi:hypothetical protein
MVLAEIDHGGLSDFNQKLLDAIETAVSQYVASAVGAQVGGYAGATAGTAIAPGVGTAVGYVVGEIVGLIVGYVIGEIYGTLKDLWNDDIFEPQMIQFTLDWPAVTAGDFSAVGHLNFTGYDGEYTVIYNWHAYTR